MKDEVALLATVTLLGVLLQGRMAPIWEWVGLRPMQFVFYLPDPGKRGKDPDLGEGQRVISTLGSYCQGLYFSRVTGDLHALGPEFWLRSSLVFSQGREGKAVGGCLQGKL